MALAESRWTGRNMSCSKRHGVAIGVTNSSDLGLSKPRAVPDRLKRSGTARKLQKQKSGRKGHGRPFLPDFAILSFPREDQALRGVFLTCCPSASNILITRSGQASEPRKAATSSPSGTSKPVVAI